MDTLIKDVKDIDNDDVVPTYYTRKCLSWLEAISIDRILSGDLSNTRTEWRLLPLASNRTVREFECIRIKASFFEFQQWKSCSKLLKGHPFSHVPQGAVAVYADYKHFRDLFGENIENFSISWQRFGLEIGIRNELTEQDSTLWLSTFGAHTPLHYDSYCTNIVVQIVGRKRWLLWPPNGHHRCNLPLPTLRIPYEESSIYSSYDPRISCSNPPHFEFILDPGDTLIVPKHWWHYVETVSDIAFSINAWVPHPRDAEDRLRESIVRFTYTAVSDSFSNSTGILCDTIGGWCNPSEEVNLLSNMLGHNSNTNANANANNNQTNIIDVNNNNSQRDNIEYLLNAIVELKSLQKKKIQSQYHQQRIFNEEYISSSNNNSNNNMNKSSNSEDAPVYEVEVDDIDVEVIIKRLLNTLLSPTVIDMCMKELLS